MVDIADFGQTLLGRQAEDTRHVLQHVRICRRPQSKFGVEAETGGSNKPRKRRPARIALAPLDARIHYDIRYATTNNFMGEVFYPSAHAFLQRPAALALVRAQQRLAADGYGLLIHDAYRPWYVTKVFWDATPAEGKIFVADPSQGSRHNRGCAVDLTLYDLKTGRPVVMPSGTRLRLQASHSKMCRSVPQIPACVTATSTSRGPTAGSGTSSRKVRPGASNSFFRASMGQIS